MGEVKKLGKSKGKAGKVSKSRTYYKKSETFEERVLDKAGAKSSQYHSSVYESLERTGRLETFLKLLSAASSMGYNKAETIRHINNYMGDYFRGKNGLSVETLNRLIERYPDVQEAWTVHRDNIAGAAVARISQLISKTTDIELLLKIAKAFDNSGIVHDSNRPTYTPTKRVITIKKEEGREIIEEEKSVSSETVETVQQLVDNWEDLDS